LKRTIAYFDRLLAEGRATSAIAAAK